MKANMAKMTELQNLRSGRLFWFNGKKCKLIYCNDCRAHVQLPDKRVTINGKTFQRQMVSDWAPTTQVEVRA